MKKLFILLLTPLLSYSNTNSPEFRSLTYCVSRASVNIDTLEDLQASYGDEQGEGLFDAQQSILKNDLIRCVRNNKNSCSNKRLDALVKEKGSNLLPSDIVMAARDCYTGK